MDRKSQINIEQLKQLLKSRKITRPRFNLPLTCEQTEAALTAAMMAEVEYRNRRFVLTENLLLCIRECAAWICSGDKFGLVVMGGVGNGKTSLVKAIQSLVSLFDLRDDYNDRISVIFKTAKDIVRLGKDDYQAFVRLRSCPMLIIDDLGEEAVDVLDYGNVINPIIDMLSFRYDAQLITMCTTNIGSDRIRNNYGDRIADRFNEMMKVIIFKDSSFRRNGQV